MKCRSTFVRRDLLLRHDRTVHAKDGGVPLHSDGKRRAGTKARNVSTPAKSSLAIDTSTLSEQIESSTEGVFDVETAAMLVADLHHKATAAMRDNGSPYDSSPAMSFTPTNTTMMDQTGSSGLPQTAPWDAFVPQGASTAKANSVASSGSDSQQSFASVSSIQPFLYLFPIVDADLAHGRHLLASRRLRY